MTGSGQTESKTQEKDGGVLAFSRPHTLTPQPQAGKKNGLFEPFIYKNEHFTKTGSGQT
jgi:hypothetical protein